VINNDGRWVGVARRSGRPASYAHLPTTDESGLIRTLCGIVGRPLRLDAGVRINACPRCQSKSQEAEETRRVRRRG
jgi:hypothetical protein